MKNIIFLIFFFIIVMPNVSSSAFEQTTSGSARALGMGEAFTGVAEGGENASLNPASLGFFQDRINLSVMYSPLFIGLDNGSLYRGAFNIASSLRKIGGFAVNVQYLEVDTNEINKIYQEYSGILSYGKKLNKKWAIGGNIKYYNWDAAESEDLNGYREQLGAKNLSLDIGFLYRIIKMLTVGLVISDFTRPVLSSDKAAKEYQDKLPIKVKLGFTFNIKKVLFALDGEYINRKMNFKIGAERWFLNNKLGARTGFQFWNAILGINYTIGMSFRVEERLTISYAFLYPLGSIESTGGTHRISLTFRRLGLK